MNRRNFIKFAATTPLGFTLVAATEQTHEHELAPRKLSIDEYVVKIDSHLFKPGLYECDGEIHIDYRNHLWVHATTVYYLANPNPIVQKVIGHITFVSESFLLRQFDPVMEAKLQSALIDAIKDHAARGDYSPLNAIPKRVVLRLAQP